MSAKKINISQIKKYLVGELDTRAMHELERQALDDPFLMDALEGYEHTGKDQQAALHDLSGRLQHRVQRKSRVTLWPTISIAASVLIFVGAGAWWLLYKQPEKSAILSGTHQVVRVKPAIPSPALKDTIKPLEPKLAKPNNRSADAAHLGAAKILSSPTLAAVQIADKNLGAQGFLKKTDTLFKAKVLNNMLAVGYLDQRGASLSANNIITTKSDTSLFKALQGRVSGLAVTTPTGERVPLSDIRIRGVGTPYLSTPLYVVDGITQSKMPIIKNDEIASVNLLKNQAATAIYGSRAANGAVLITTKQGKFGQQDSVDNNAGQNQQFMTGQVVAKADNTPLPGVSVTVAGKSYKTITDAEGRFVIKADKNDLLSFNYVGFETQKLKAVSKDNIKVALNESQGSLSEVVVVGYGTQKEITDKAHPANGWSQFKNYVKKNASSPDGKPGVVKVSFTVNADNTLSHFKITKSVGSETDKKAIDLIKNGPTWVHNMNNEPEEVTVRIRFKR